MTSMASDMNRKRKNPSPNKPNEDKRSRLSAPLDSLWVDKYRPESTKLVIGQQGDKSCVNKLIKWLSNWQNNLDKKPAFNSRFGSDDGQGFRAALLSGPPGVGKTTSAQLICKELGYDFVELNASDSRSKRTLDVVVKELLQNTTLTNFFTKSATKHTVTAKHVVIMDEVDGMAGNEDRGGVAELIQLIKSTKVPIICICNDRSHPKMRSLVSYCFDLRFSKPRIEQIKGPMMSIAYKEGIQIAPNVLHELIVSSNQDIRQVLHNLSLLGTGTKRIQNLMSEKSVKDVKLGPFEAVRKVFTAGDDYRQMSFADKSDLFFCDYSLMPLFNFENYCLVNPTNAKTDSQKLKMASKTIEALAFGDIIEKQIRGSNNWSLLPLQAAFASVMPGAYMNGHMGGQINFPSFMGKLSTTNKRNRLLQELKMHMNLKISGSKTALNLDYLEPLRDSIIEPLVTNGTGGVPNSIEKLETYCLRREDIESMIELTLWNNQKDPMSRVDSKVKAALTRAYNKEGFCLPYSLGTTTKGKKGKSAVDLNNEMEGNEDDGTADDGDEDDDNDDVAADAMIKAKKTKKATGKETKTKPNKTKKSETNDKEGKRKQKNESISKDKKNEVKVESPVKTPIKSRIKSPKKPLKKSSPIKSSKQSPKKITRESPKKTVIKSPEKVTKETNKKKSKETTKEMTKETNKKTLKETTIETNKKASKETTKETNKKASKETTKETNKKASNGYKKSPQKSPTKTSEQLNGKKNKTKAEPKSESKSDSKQKKTPENKSTTTASKGRQLTLNAFFSRK